MTGAGIMRRNWPGGKGGVSSRQLSRMEGAYQMRGLSITVACRDAGRCLVVLGLLACRGASTSTTASGGIPGTAPSAATTGATITGFAFVDSSVTGQGSKAKLPAGTKIYPNGARITGTDGCPTTRYQTDGLIV